MKRILLAAALLLTFATIAAADCYTNTTYYRGRMVTCTTCCVGNSCSTNCF